MKEDLPYTKTIIQKVIEIIEKADCPLPEIPNETTSIFQSGFQEAQKIIISNIKEKF
jgi:hypothetical protein